MGSWPFRSKSRHRAGESALAEWRALRWRNLREEWQGWAVISGFTLAAVVWTMGTSGVPQLIGAGLTGAFVTLLAFGWTLGGDVHSLTWIWGRIGEQQTETVLARLSAEWVVEHDIPRERGNWDHVVVGPGGVFLLDSKRLHGPAFAAGDALRAGRTRFAGGGFRHAALELSDALAQLLPRRPWVQAVVVVWDEFPQGRYEEERVAYIAGTELIAWLTDQPHKLTATQRAQYSSAIGQLRGHHAPEARPAARDTATTG